MYQKTKKPRPSPSLAYYQICPYKLFHRPYPFSACLAPIVRPKRAPYWSPSVSIVTLLVVLLLRVVFDSRNCYPIRKFRTSLLADDGDLDILADVVVAVMRGVGARIAPRFQAFHLDVFDYSLFALTEGEIGDRVRGWGSSASPTVVTVSNCAFQDSTVCRTAVVSY